MYEIIMICSISAIGPMLLVRHYIFHTVVVLDLHSILCVVSSYMTAPLFKDIAKEASSIFDDLCFLLLHRLFSTVLQCKLIDIL